MWALTFGQVLLQLIAGLGFFSQLLGFAGFVLAVFLVTRKEKAARVNGGVRLVLAILGFMFHLLAKSVAAVNFCHNPGSQIHSARSTSPYPINPPQKPVKWGQGKRL